MISRALKSFEAKESLSLNTGLIDQINSSLNHPTHSLPSILKGLIKSILVTYYDSGSVRKPSSEIASMDEARAGVERSRSQVRYQDIAELRSFCNPPEKILFISKLCRLLVEGPTTNKTEWNMLLQYFKQALDQKLDTITPKRVELIKNEI